MKKLSDARIRFVYEGIHPFESIEAPELDPSASWVIFNATRPIQGQKVWQSKFIGGIFYAAVNIDVDFEADLWSETMVDRPSDEMVQKFIDGIIDLNVRNDAAVLIWVTDDDLQEFAYQYTEKGDFSVGQMEIFEDECQGSELFSLWQTARENGWKEAKPTVSHEQAFYNRDLAFQFQTTKKDLK